VQESASTDSFNAYDVSTKNPASLHIVIITVLVLWHSNYISSLFD